MKDEKKRNIRLGLFVLIGTALIIAALYTIGSNQNLFGSKFRIVGEFRHVSGLMAGNNVRYSGINVGTVESVKIVSDSTIRVVMIIQKTAKEFIKKNAVASIGTDGLMGNKLVNIAPGNESSETIEDGGTIRTIDPLATEEMLRTLSRTNEDVATIAHNLRSMTEQINSPNSLWNLLSDTILSENVRQAMVNINVTSERTAIITGDLSRIIASIKAGKGTLGALLTGTSLLDNLEQTIVSVKVVSDTLGYVTGDLKTISQKIKEGEGVFGTILMDTVFVHDLNKSMENIRKGSEGFNENMEALKNSIFLRRYFRKQQKK